MALRWSAGFGGCRPSIDMSLLWSVRPPLGDGGVGNSGYRGEANPPNPPCQGGNLGSQPP